MTYFKCVHFPLLHPLLCCLLPCARSQIPFRQSVRQTTNALSLSPSPVPFLLAPRFQQRLQRLVWRLQSPYSIFVGATVCVPWPFSSRPRGPACAPPPPAGRATKACPPPPPSPPLTPLSPHPSLFLRFSSLSLVGVKHFATSAGASTTHRDRVAANGTYAKRHYAEVNDNPLYRLPENPVGGHRLDGLSQQMARREALQHH